MARKRRKKKAEQGPVLQHDGLAPAFPSSPMRPPRFCIYASYPDAPLGQGRRWVWTFSAEYAAQHFINHLIGEDGHKWKKRNTIRTSRGIEIRSGEGDDDLEVVMDYKMSLAEEAWAMPPHRLQQIEMFRQPLLQGHTPPTPIKHTPHKPRTSRDGLTPISVICERLGIEDRDARAALRRARIEKPDCGWAWSHNDAAKIERLLTKSR